jgi:hypothetical protein
MKSFWAKETITKGIFEFCYKKIKSELKNCQFD